MGQHSREMRLRHDVTDRDSPDVDTKLAQRSPIPRRFGVFYQNPIARLKNALRESKPLRSSRSKPSPPQKAIRGATAECCSESASQTIGDCQETLLLYRESHKMTLRLCSHECDAFINRRFESCSRCTRNSRA